MKVEERLFQERKIIDSELRQILSREDSLLFQAMRQAVFSGGKRFRPLLTLSAGECFDVSQVTLLPFACALELIHNYSLIHDDLPSMDNDDFRRSQPSCHKVYGEDVALLAGDGLLTLAFEVMAKADLEKRLQPKKELLMSEISHSAGVMGMIGGQLMDISLSQEEITEEIFHELILKKTGALIIASLRVGAILGEASDKEAEAIIAYGKNIGLAFQVRDDILDAAKESKEDDVPRPNYVALFGLEESKRRLNHFVETGIEALEEASLESEKLRYLASRLLRIKDRKENE